MLCPHCNRDIRSDVSTCSYCGRDWLIGNVLDDRYEILEFVGGGGMGRVYKGRDTLLDYNVAIKALMRQGVSGGGFEAELQARFRREAKAAAWSSSHPNVVPIHDVKEARENQPAYIVMAFVEGKSLYELLKRERRISPGRAVSLMLEICAGVGAAHQSKVLHRDLKPKNVMVIAPNQLQQREAVKVLDFGLAKLRRIFEGLTLTQITQLGQQIGSPPYMAPEQWRGEEPDADDYSSDVYSLGVMFYEMLKGEWPIRGSNMEEFCDRHLHRRPPPLGVSGVPPALEQVIMLALEKDRHKRPADAIEFGLKIQAAWLEDIETNRLRKEDEQRRLREEEISRHQAQADKFKLHAENEARRAEEEKQMREDAEKALQINSNVITRMNFELKSFQEQLEVEINQRRGVESALRVVLAGIDGLAEETANLRSRAEAEIERLQGELQNSVASNVVATPVSEEIGLHTFADDDTTITGGRTKASETLEVELEYLRVRLDAALGEIIAWQTKAEAAQLEIDELSSDFETKVSHLKTEYELVKADLTTSQVALEKYEAEKSNLTASKAPVELRPRLIVPKPPWASLLLRKFFALFSSDLAIDLGTANTLVYAKGRGIVVSEPSIVAINKVTNTIVAFGKEALGKSSDNIIVIRPMNDGVIANFEVTEKMLQHFIRKAHNGTALVSPRVVIGIPSEISQAERMMVWGAAYAANASDVHLVETPMAAAIGAGLPITEPHGNMIVDIGRGTTDIAVISLSGIVYSRAVRVAGNEMDEAITQYIRRKYNLLIGERTAEAIKIQLGSAFPLDEPLSKEVRGRNLTDHTIKTVTVTHEEIREALADCVQTLVNAVRVALERTPPELTADIVERGVTLTGGGAELKSFDKRLSIETGLPVHVAEDPLTSVAIGLGKMLSDYDLLKRVNWDYDLTPSVVG
jgi:rod shape-determining protein MreB